MNQQEKKFITRNLVKLIDCTKELSRLGPCLVANGFISSNTWKSIMKRNPGDEHTQITEIYDQCMRTPKYSLLVDVLIESENEEAAKILTEAEFYIPTIPNSPEVSSDFLITENGAPTIVDVLKEPALRMEDSWKTIQEVLLSPSKRNLDEKNLGIRILKTLKFWIEEGKLNSSTTFAKLYDSIKAENVPAADALLKNKEIIGAKCI